MVADHFGELSAYDLHYCATDLDVARLPQHASEAVFGRPLFQGLSFHDAPADPLPKITYLDSLAKADLTHSYCAIALSSAGAPPLPSAPASDTPTAPVPEMRYLDASSHAGEKHTYTVITLNGAGVPSEPSAPTAVR